MSPLTPDTDLLGRLRAALAAGTITPDDLRAVLREAEGAGDRPPGATRVLQALGIVVVFLGVGLAYATAYPDLPDIARLLTPFVFPGVGLTAWFLLVRRGRPLWETETAAAVGLIALGAALAASWGGAQDVDIDVWGVCASVAGGAVALLLVRYDRRSGVARVGVAVALVAFANFLASVLGLQGNSFRWLELVLAAVAIGVGAHLLGRDRDTAGIALAAGVLLLAAACMIGVTGVDEDVDGLTAWHALLSVTVAAAGVVASALRMPVVVAAAVVAALVWLIVVVPVAGSSLGWALVVAGIGAAIAGVGLVAARLGARGGP